MEDLSAIQGKAFLPCFSSVNVVMASVCALLSGSLSCRLCLSITDFHPDTWNPAWSVSTILTGLLSFMVEKGPTLGSIETSDFTVRGGERTVRMSGGFPPGTARCLVLVDRS